MLLLSHIKTIITTHIKLSLLHTLNYLYNILKLSLLHIKTIFTTHIKTIFTTYSCSFSHTLKLSLLRPTLLSHVRVLRVPFFLFYDFPSYYFMRSPLKVGSSKPLKSPISITSYSPSEIKRLLRVWWKKKVLFPKHLKKSYLNDIPHSYSPKK